MIFKETMLTFSQAASHLPRMQGKKIHTSTLWRWARKGVQGVKLETRKLGGRFFTSLEALERFSKALAEKEPDRGASVQVIPKKSLVVSESEKRRRLKQIEAAERFLEGEGV